MALGVAGVGFSAVPAAASPGQTGHGIVVTLDFTTSWTPPGGELQPPPHAPQLSPSAAGCPFDINAVFTITGNGVGHGTGNNNGFWFGETVEGAASVADGSGPIYVGHASAWTGFGTNQSQTDNTGQAEVGLTFDFHGVSTADPSQTLSVHIDWHGTKNNSGTITTFPEHFTCS